MRWGLCGWQPICEKIVGSDVSETLAETGAEVLLVPNGSPITVVRWMFVTTMVSAGYRNRFTR